MSKKKKGETAAQDEIEKNSDAAVSEAEGENEQPDEDAQAAENSPQTPEQNNDDTAAVDDAKDKEIADLKDKLLRSMAEFDNYRKRTAKERLDLNAEITAKNLTELLPVMDNLDRALASECSDENYKKGVEMIHESFKTALANLGVEEISSDGAMFDPTVHQAVQQVEDENFEEGAVVATFQKGYKIGDKVLRFAMVSVAK